MSLLLQCSTVRLPAQSPTSSVFWVNYNEPLFLHFPHPDTSTFSSNMHQITTEAYCSIAKKQNEGALLLPEDLWHAACRLEHLPCLRQSKAEAEAKARLELKQNPAQAFPCLWDLWLNSTDSQLQGSKNKSQRQNRCKATRQNIVHEGG